MSIKKQTVDKLTAKKDLETSRSDAWGTLSSNLLSLQLSAYSLSKPATYDTKTATASNLDILTATTNGTAVAGSYNFYVQQLATASQLSTNGFYDYDTTKLGAGTLNLELGNGDVRKQTDLNILNGGNGVTRGYIKITNRAGNSATIDLTKAMNIDDVTSVINNSGLGVTASVDSSGNKLSLSTATGINDFKIEEVNGGTTATDLGIKQTVSADTITGSKVNYLSASNNVSSLNDGLGITKQSFVINDGVHGDKTVVLTGVTTIQDVINAIAAVGTNVTASINASGDGLALSTTGGAFTITESGSYTSAKDLGLIGMTGAGDGNKLLAGMNSVLLSSLNGAAGISGNSITLNTNYDVGSSTYLTTTNIDITGKQSLSGVIEAINAQSGTTNVMARYNSAQNGLELYSTNSTNFNVSGATSNSLGIAGDSSSTVLKGSDLEYAYIGKNVTLSKLNQGAGVRAGTISITNKNGTTFDINLTSSSIKTVGDVVNTINNVGSAYNISASINSTGDGIIINDSSVGTGNLVIAEKSNGHMAEDLGIKGTTSSSAYNGSFERTINITANNTLQDVRTAINNLGMNVNASIINDGSNSPFRLVLTSTNSGRDGRIVFSSSLSSLNMNTAVEAKNAVLVMGDPTSENAVFKSSSTNNITDFVAGVTLNLKTTSSSPITVTVTNDVESVVTTAKDFVDKFNKNMSFINTQLHYSADTSSSEPLFGDSNIMLIQQQVYSMITKSVPGLSGTITSASQIGMSLGLDGQLTLNEATLRSTLLTATSDVKDFFTFENNASLSATASGTTPDSPWTTNGAMDGDINVSDFADGSTGWQADNGSNYVLNFGSRKELTSIKIYGVDTASTDTLKSYDIQYWDTSTNGWTTYRSLSASTAKDNYIYFPSGLVTSKIRLNNLQSNGSKAKLLDVQAYETVGMAGAMELSLSKITSASTGTVSAALDGIANNQSVLDAEIASQNERLTLQETRLRAQFTKMEEALNQLKSQSTSFSGQLAGISANWGTGK